ncbi:MAG: ribose 5-phosphate isomerase B [Alphaproteobacteria bacterium]|nr:ribose 5-phosphate isomerase B [Alphaproteobacteria bacterium]
MAKQKHIAIACDHAGFALKQHLCLHLQTHQLCDKIIDFGTDSEQSVDYPDYAHLLCEAITKGDVDTGILICGSGTGMVITANRYPDSRAALCYNTEMARLARLHNNANIIVLGARFITETDACNMLDAFLQTEFEGGRHERRLNKITPDNNIVNQPA